MTRDDLRLIVAWLRDGGAEMMVDCPAPAEPWDLTEDPRRLLFIFLLAATDCGEVSVSDVTWGMPLSLIKDADAWAQSVVNAIRVQAIDSGAIEPRSEDEQEEIT